MQYTFNKYKELINTRSYSSHDGRKYAEQISNIFLEADEKNKHEMLDFLLSILSDIENYKHFSFEEIVVVFTINFYEFNDFYKQKIIDILIKNFKEICKSDNYMIPFTMMDFIDFNCTHNQKKYFLNEIKNKYKNLSIDEERYLKQATRKMDRSI